ncbi:MAG: gfo/Idh/MocA family oxidoreductase, partial [Candidatus Methanomethylicaceae archaeon]
VRTMTATGSLGIAVLDYIEQTVKIETSSVEKKIGGKKIEPLRIEIEHFLECVRTGKKPMVDGEEGLKNLRIALEAIKCGSSG